MKVITHRLCFVIAAIICFFSLIGCASYKIVPQYKKTPFSQYDSVFVSSINTSWYALLAEQKGVRHKPGRVEQKGVRHKPGRVVLKFHLTSDGQITDMKVLEDNVGDGQSLLCQKAILAPVPYKSWPNDMIRMVGENYRTMTFNFYYQ